MLNEAHREHVVSEEGELVLGVRVVRLEGVPQELDVFLLLRALEGEWQVVAQFGCFFHGSGLRTLFAAIADHGDPVFEPFNVGLEFRRPGHRRAGRRRLVMAGQPCRAFRHRRFDSLAVRRGDIGDLGNLLSLNTRPVAFDHATQQHFFQGAFPGFPQKAVEILGFLLVGVLMTVARELVGRLPAILQIGDFLLDRERDPRQLLRAPLHPWKGTGRADQTARRLTPSRIA